MESSQQDTTSGSDCDSMPETDREDQPGPSKIPMITKTKDASKYRTKFNKAWITTFHSYVRFQGDHHSFYCTTCRQNVSCSHIGRHNIEWHTGLPMYKANVKAAWSQSMLSFQPTSSPLAEQVFNYIIIFMSEIMMYNNYNKIFFRQHEQKLKTCSVYTYNLFFIPNIWRPSLMDSASS